MYFLGIDPGRNGALAIVHEGGRLCGIGDLPYAGKELDYLAFAHFLRDLRREYSSLRAVIEQQIPMPVLRAGVPGAPGSVSSFRMGKGYGALLMGLAAHAIPYVCIAPVVWKRALELGADKWGSITRALSMWPEAPLTKQKHHNRAEAMLLAWYGVTNGSGVLAEPYDPFSDAWVARTVGVENCTV